MSWSFNAVGTPEKVKTEMRRRIESYSGQSQLEFREAAAGIEILLDQNFDIDGRPVIVQVDAQGSGEATTRDGGPFQISRGLNVTVKKLYGALV